VGSNSRQCILGATKISTYAINTKYIAAAFMTYLWQNTGCSGQETAKSRIDKVMAEKRKLEEKG
jgi:hypothetical protein